jgi:hypothetical protein
MSILTKLSNLKKATNVASRTPMTDTQFDRCKAAIKAKNYGYNVQPNRFDVAMPYRVAINFNDKWDNFGNFKSADVAAAVGTIVSAAYFGEKAVQGVFDAEVVEKSEEFKTWMADERNAEVIAKANGEVAPVLDDEHAF